MNRAMPIILIFVCALSLQPLTALSAECAASKASHSIREADGCVITTYTGKFYRDGVTVEYSSDRLTCGDHTLIDSEPTIEQGRQGCEQFSGTYVRGPENPFHHNQQIDLVGSYQGLISVEIVRYTDLGPHPMVTIERRTFDKTTGRQMTLADLFGPGPAEHILAAAKEKHHCLAQHDLYEFDADAFALFASPDGGIKVEFAFDSTQFALSGQTLVFDVVTASPLLKER